MGISEFGFGVLESLVASIIVTGLAAISLRYWKNIALGLGAMLFIAIACTAVIWGIQSAFDKYQEHKEVVYVQDRIDRYVKGNYKTYYDQGWRIKVDNVNPRLVLALGYPENIDVSKVYHPFYTPSVRMNVTNMLKNEGYSKEPAWVFIVNPISEEEYLKQLEAQG